MFVWKEDIDYSNTPFNEMYTIYENQYYKAVFIRPCKNGKPLTVKDPTNSKQLFFTITNKIKKYPTISAVIRKIDDENECNAIIGVPFGRTDVFSNMHNETGMWADACRTLIEANELVKELYPGYHITEKTTY